MKKEQVTHISHNPQPQSLALPPTAKLPLESDPVLKKKFESALKMQIVFIKSVIPPAGKKVWHNQPNSKQKLFIKL